MTDVNREEVLRGLRELDWYHTLEILPGVFTPGLYDHRRYLRHYGLPDDLAGKTVLDVGAASGFFSFELEERGGQVTALDLPSWAHHDFGPLYELDCPVDEAERYLREPFQLAKRARGSSIETRYLSVYDLTPESVGCFDLVFCGSVLLHVSDPVRALVRIRDVTRGMAVIATGIVKDRRRRPWAAFHGADDGTVWWLPNRWCLEKMIKAAGFSRWRWISDFRLDCADGRKGIHHGVVHAWTDRPAT